MFKRLPFYFSPDAAGSDSKQEGAQPNNSIKEDANKSQNASEESKTYTQKELQELLAKEKRQGKNSVLNALGLKSVDEAKAALNAAKAAADANKTEEQIAADALNAAKNAQKIAEDGLLKANRTILVMKQGFSPDYVDDVVAIASGKVTEDKDFESVLEDMKKSHPFYLTESAKASEGTGTAASGFKKNSNGAKTESYGERLAKKNMETAERANKVKFFDD